MKSKFLIASLALACCTTMSVAAADKVVGYYPYWSQYSQFYPKDLRYDFVTNIHYVGLVPAEDGSLAFADENDTENFKTLAQMSAEHNVKLIVSVGGVEMEGVLKSIADSEELTSTFVSNVNEWLTSNGANGVELDWQNLTAEDAESFGKLSNALIDGLSGMEVTAAVYPAAMEAYNAEVLNKFAYLDMFMADQMTEESSSVVPNQGAVQVEEQLGAFAEKGINKDLLNPVIFLYGKSWIGAQGLGTSHQGFGSGNDGYIPYKELMVKFNTPDYTVTFDESSKSEVAVSSAETIVFMGIPSVKAVAENVKSEGYSGVAVYDLSQDHHESIVSLLVTIGLELRPDVNYKPAKKK